MRVVLVCPYSWSFPGGVQTHVAGLARSLRARGAEVEILAPGDGEDSFPGLITVGRSVPILDNGSIVRVALSPSAIARTARLVASHGYDLVHLHEPMIPGGCLSALMTTRAPLVGTFHMYASRPRWYRPFAPLSQHALASLDARIAVSEAALRHAARTCPGTYEVIPNGIDICPQTARGGSGSSSRILFVGRPEPRKGLPILLAAFERLPAAITLDLVGPTPRDVARARAPSDPRRRAHPGARPRRRGGAQAPAGESDVLCAPTLEGESFGIVLVEAMAAGVPVVASAIPGYVDVLPPACGRLVPPGDPAHLARALAELLADDRPRAAMGAAGRAESRRFSWPVVCEQILAVYARALAHRRGPRAAEQLAKPVRSSPQAESAPPPMRVETCPGHHCDGQLDERWVGSMTAGTVKWFNDEKGYGFIATDDGKDVFVHYTGIADGGFRTLPEGAKVEFEVREGRKGLEAFNVVVTGRPKEPYPSRKEARTGPRAIQRR